MFCRKTKKPPKPKSPNGRKFTMGLICILVVLAGFALTLVSPILTKVYVDLVGGVVGVYLVYCGGNVSNKWVLSKTNGVTLEQKPTNPGV